MSTDPRLFILGAMSGIQNELVLQNDLGESQAVSKKSLVEMFKVISSDIKLIVFNTCFSGNQAAEVTDHIPASIGMNDSIGDQAARVFASSSIPQ